MILRRFLVVLVALGPSAAVELACSPQVVDAVDPANETGGSSGTSGTGGDTSSGGGTSCPDGGSDQDRDGDGVPDCADHCPLDPLKTTPGACGCGLPNPIDVPDGGASCNDLTALIAHRYAFGGTRDSTLVLDTQAGTEGNGEVLNASLSGSGTLALAGVASDQYVSLPNGLASAQASATFEAWLQWNGGNAWQRIFDFGSNNGVAEGEQGGSGSSYLFLTTRTTVNTVNPLLLLTGKLRLVYRRVAFEPELIVEAPIAFPSGGNAPTQVVAVIDAENQRMSIYVNGERQAGLAFVAYGSDGTEYVVVNETGPYDWSVSVPGLGTTPPAIDLTALNDVNNWLGRSQFSADDEFGGTYYDFRIYQGALTDEQIAISYKGGPDPVFFQ